MSILITIGIVVCGIVWWQMRQDSKRVRYRDHEITGLDLWKVRRR